MNPEISYVSQSDKSSPEPIPQSFFNRLIGVYFSPGETFQEIGRAPRILMPLILLMVIGALSGYLMIDRIGVRSVLNSQFEPAVASGKMSQEEADKQIEVLSTGVVGVITRYSFPVAGLLNPPILALIVVGICKLIIMLIGGDSRFKPLFSVTMYTLLAVSLVSTTVLILLLYLKPPDEFDINNPIGSNLAAISTLALGKDGLPKFIMALGRWVDIFFLWILALLAIGYAAVSHKVKASTMGIALGCIYALVALVAAAVAVVRG
jgi:Yip1 domain